MKFQVCNNNVVLSLKKQKKKQQQQVKTNELAQEIQKRKPFIDN